MDETTENVGEVVGETVEETVEAISETAGETVEAIGETAGDTVEAIGQAAEHLTDLGNIAAVASLAVILGLVFVRLRQPPIVGYIAAGILLGPTGLGIVEQSESITLLAEMGVLLLLFLIGMELSIRAFVLVLVPALLIAAGQLVTGMGVSFLFGWLLGWSAGQTLLLAFIVALSSTAVAIKVLDDIGELRTETGRITIGVLIAQDIAIVPMLIIAESFGASGDGQPVWQTLVLITAAVVILGALIWYLNMPGKITLPFTRYFTGKPDLITLAMLAFCFAVAAISSLFGLSAVYGAFIAGLIIANSTLRSEAIQLTYPVQSILVFIFFLSIGLLIDLDYIMANWKTVLLFVLAVVIIKTLLNIVLVRRTGFSWDVAVPAGLAMAQIGEFSFILASVGLANRVLDFDAYRLALSVIAVTLMISPLWMITIRRFHAETTEGISTMREALALAYASELDRLQAAGEAVSSARFRGRVYYRAARMAANKRRHKKKSVREVMTPHLSHVEKHAEGSPPSADEGAGKAGEKA